MKTYSIRSLLIFMIVISVMLVLARFAYTSYYYHTTVKPAWEVFPVSSRLVALNEENDIEILICRSTMNLESNATLLPATDFRDLRYTGNLTGNYDLNCSSGEFRIIFTGRVWDALSDELRGQRNAFQTIRDALILTLDSPVTKKEYWNLRKDFGYSGSDVHIRHFESNSKSGFIVRHGDQSTLELFDSIGNYSILVRPKSTSITELKDLAERLTLRLK